MIRMLRELIEYSKCIREEIKATLSEIIKNSQGTNSEGKEAGGSSIQKKKSSIRRIWDISKSANI